MSVKWLAVIGLVAVPMLAQAECGWLLMVPQQLGPGGKLPPLIEWRQDSAYDSAELCERERMMPQPNLRGRELIVHARCLPASQVPVR